MAKILFFEKTGCKNNTKQKQVLAYSGHEVEAVDIINHPWTRNELLDFFKDIEPNDWFNLNAPSITDGSVNPDLFDSASALEALIKEHILIRRPLMIIGETRIVGFNIEEINKMATINKEAHPTVSTMLEEIAQGCPNKSEECNT